MSDTANEGGDPACWAHLFAEDARAEADRASPPAAAPGSPSSARDDDQDDEQDGRE